MLDRWVIPWVSFLIKPLVYWLKKKNIAPDTVTIVSFFLGVGAMGLISQGFFLLGLLFILLNRLGDGLDGRLARLTKPTDRGSFLDIVLDFIFYSGVVLAFIIYNPEKNALAGSVLMFSFVGTGTSFLAFSIIAERRKLKSTIYQQKGIYYLIGLAEGTETILFFILICLFPSCFVVFSFIFAVVCFLTTFLRILMGYRKFTEI